MYKSKINRFHDDLGVRFLTKKMYGSLQALPLPRQHELLKLVIGRLNDKSSQVRKYAIQLISALLRTNPFAAKVRTIDSIAGINCSCICEHTDETNQSYTRQSVKC